MWNNKWQYVDADDRPLQEGFEYTDVDGREGVITYSETEETWFFAAREGYPKTQEIPFLARKGRVRKTYRYTMKLRSEWNKQKVNEGKGSLVLP